MTLAPRFLVSDANAYPIFPLDLLDRYLIGSMDSFVGPAVIVTFLFFNGN